MKKKTSKQKPRAIVPVSFRLEEHEIVKVAAKRAALPVSTWLKVQALKAAGRIE